MFLRWIPSQACDLQHPEADVRLPTFRLWQKWEMGKGWDTSEKSNSSIKKGGYFEAKTSMLSCCHNVKPWYLIHPQTVFSHRKVVHNGKSQYVQWAQLKHETLNWEDSMDEFSSSRKPIKPQEIVWFFLYYIKHIVWGHLMLSFG